MQAIAMPVQTIAEHKILPKETSLSIHQNIHDILLVNIADGTTMPLTGKHTVIECNARTGKEELVSALGRMNENSKTAVVISLGVCDEDNITVKMPKLVNIVAEYMNENKESVLLVCDVVGRNHEKNNPDENPLLLAMEYVTSQFILNCHSRGLTIGMRMGAPATEEQIQKTVGKYCDRAKVYGL